MHKRSAGKAGDVHAQVRDVRELINLLRGEQERYAFVSFDDRAPIINDRC
jgi:hypothetical protein